MKSLFDKMTGPDEADPSSAIDDAMPVDDSKDGEEEPGGGPFDTYADTVLDDQADPAARKDALRQAILTLIEEKGS